MVKLKMLSMHKIENVPDHVLQEIQDFAIKLTSEILVHVNTVQPNIAIAGINWAQACVIKYLITNNAEELRKAANFSCSMLLSNMEILIQQMQEEKHRNEKCIQEEES